MNRNIEYAAPSQFQILAEFRHQLRLFLHFSETAAQNHGLQPQQHQLLLQIAGAPDEAAATIGYVAERLGLRHNTAVELSNRSEEAGLVMRKPGADRRCVVLRLSRKGQKMLTSLSIDHARELNELAPRLIRTLTKLKAVHKQPRKQTTSTKLKLRMVKRNREI
jgi:DNA-binding MarR family transcriptional regulator